MVSINIGFEYLTIATTPLNPNMQPQPKKKSWLSFMGGN